MYIQIGTIAFKKGDTYENASPLLSETTNDLTTAKKALLKSACDMFASDLLNYSVIKAQNKESKKQ